MVAPGIPDLRDQEDNCEVDLAPRIVAEDCLGVNRQSGLINCGETLASCAQSASGPRGRTSEKKR